MLSGEKKRWGSSKENKCNREREKKISRGGDIEFPFVPSTLNTAIFKKILMYRYDCLTVWMDMIHPSSWISEIGQGECKSTSRPGIQIQDFLATVHIFFSLHYFPKLLTLLPLPQTNMTIASQHSQLTPNMSPQYKSL